MMEARADLLSHTWEQMKRGWPTLSVVQFDARVGLFGRVAQVRPLLANLGQLSIEVEQETIPPQLRAITAFATRLLFTTLAVGFLKGVLGARESGASPQNPCQALRRVNSLILF